MNDQHLISPYSITLESYVKEGNGHQLKKLLIVRKILLISSQGNA